MVGRAERTEVASYAVACAVKWGTVERDLLNAENGAMEVEDQENTVLAQSRRGRDNSGAGNRYDVVKATVR